MSTGSSDTVIEGLASSSWRQGWRRSPSRPGAARCLICEIRGSRRLISSSFTGYSDTWIRLSTFLAHTLVHWRFNGIPGVGLRRGCRTKAKERTGGDTLAGGLCHTRAGTRTQPVERNCAWEKHARLPGAITQERDQQQRNANPTQRLPKTDRQRQRKQQQRHQDQHRRGGAGGPVGVDNERQGDDNKETVKESTTGCL